MEGFEYLSVEELNTLFPEIILRIEKDDFHFSYKNISIRDFSDTQSILESNNFIFQNRYNHTANFLFDPSGELSLFDDPATYANITIVQLERGGIQLNVVLTLEKTIQPRRYFTLSASRQDYDIMLYRFKKPQNYPVDQEVFIYTYGSIRFSYNHLDERYKHIEVLFNNITESR